MRLILLRHAKSEKAEPGMSDHPRRLNARGKNDAAVIGAYMVRHAFAADLVLVSTAERTRQTWERVAAALPKPPRVVYEERLYNAGGLALRFLGNFQDKFTASVMRLRLRDRFRCVG